MQITILIDVRSRAAFNAARPSQPTRHSLSSDALFLVAFASYFFIYAPVTAACELKERFISRSAAAHRSRRVPGFVFLYVCADGEALLALLGSLSAQQHLSLSRDALFDNAPVRTCCMCDPNKAMGVLQEKMLYYCLCI